MKRLCIILICIILAGASALAEASAPVGLVMPELSVATTDGKALALSDILKEKDVVILSLFTSRCRPCRTELPKMEAVYRDLSDRMEIVAVSDEPGDTLEVIARYKAELGLSFPMGLAVDAALTDLVEIETHPATLVIDKTGKVGYFQRGSFASEAQFREIVEHFLNEHYDGTPVGAFNVSVRDQYGQPVPGVVIQFCDTACRAYTTDSEGVIGFTGKPVRYNIHIVRVPEGYSCDPSFDAVCDGSGEWVIVEVVKE